MTRLKSALSLFMVAISTCAQNNSPAQSSKALTPDQVAEVHGKLFQAGAPGQIQQQLEAKKGDVTLRPIGMSSEIGIDMPLDAKLLNLTCRNDIVIVGRAGTRISHPTANQGFIYSDWQFTVEQVLKDNPKAPISSGMTIVVVRPGGILEIGGRKVYAKLQHFREFTPGEELLLYLNYVPETGAYLIRVPNFFSVTIETLKTARDAISYSARDCGGAQ
jgi:hypothetical protein